MKRELSITILMYCDGTLSVHNYHAKRGELDWKGYIYISIIGRVQITINGNRWKTEIILLDKPLKSEIPLGK